MDMLDEIQDLFDRLGIGTPEDRDALRKRLGPPLIHEVPDSLALATRWTWTDNTGSVE